VHTFNTAPYRLRGYFRRSGRFATPAWRAACSLGIRMHMADALLSPTIGLLGWGAAAAVLTISSRRLRGDAQESVVPLMGVLGAFVFAAQMINFSIPGTGSSGHIGGGLLLAILLGPQAAFIVIASVLTVQALLFADGGLLALGVNMVNLGFIPCYLAYPLVFKPLAGAAPSGRRLALATVVATVVGLQLGALGVVIETTASSISSLPFESFATLMLPIHLVIGLIEGIATAALILVLRRARPELIRVNAAPLGQRSLRPVLVGMGLAAVIAGGALSSFASEQPDGLEWSIARVAGEAGLPEAVNSVHSTLAKLQESLALLPDYSLPRSGADTSPPEASDARGTSLAGLLGGGVTLLVVAGLGWALRRRLR
ncbi:MAG: energy-coupling factor ABC transporter permease, partial [Burkholderiaceae bacterium]